MANANWDRLQEHGHFLFVHAVHIAYSIGNGGSIDFLRPSARATAVRKPLLRASKLVWYGGPLLLHEMLVTFHPTYAVVKVQS